MKPYLSFLKLRISVGLQYRFATITGIFTQFFWGAMYIFIYEAYYKMGTASPMPWEQLVSYLWIQQAFFALIRFSYNSSDICDSIITGQVVYELVRPFNIYWHWYAQTFAGRLSNVLLRFSPIIIVALLLPDKYALHFPASFASFVLFLLTLILGLFLSISLTMIIYGIMFYTTSSRGIFNIYGIIAEFFAGSILPILFMPEFFQKLAYMLPFRLIVDLPFRLYIGNISVQDGCISVMLQIIWIVIFVTIGNLIMNNARKKVVSQGG